MDSERGWDGWVLYYESTRQWVKDLEGVVHVAELVVGETVIISWTSDDGIWINGLDLAGVGQRLNGEISEVGNEISGFVKVKLI
jgi:hypothetical protein